MHYLGFVFVDEPTEAAVEKAMEHHKDEHWDWYRCGGRWDGYFLGETEMTARETHNGFNFDDKNKSALNNAVLVKDLKPDQRPAFFVAGYDFIPKEYYNAYERSPYPSQSGKQFYGAILPTPDFEQRYLEALEANKDKWCVVVDAHN
jgi:hypothetical protein